MLLYNHQQRTNNPDTEPGEREENKMKEFKEFVLDKCKEWDILDTENIYFSQTRYMYYADYKPNYPEKTNCDFTISQEVISGKRKMYGNFNALIPTIIEL